MIMGQGPQTAGELSARAAALAEHLPDVLYTVRVEPDVACEFVSAAIVDVVGYTPEQHYDDPLFPMRLVAQADRPLLLQLAEQPVGPLVEFTARWIADDGREVWMQHRCRKHRRPDGSVVVLGSAREVRAPGSTDAAPGLVVLRPLETAPVDPEAWARESDVGPDPCDWSGISVGWSPRSTRQPPPSDEHAASGSLAITSGGGRAVDVLEHLVAEGQRLVGEAWLATAGPWPTSTSPPASPTRCRRHSSPTRPGRRPTRPAPSAGARRLRGGETHTLPARMLADHLRLAGCGTVFLGAATKGQLHALVHHWEPDVIVLSCTMVPNLPGLAESLSAVSDARCPVVVGGAAVPGPEIAARLGADAWQPDAVALTDFVLGEPTRSARRMAAARSRSRSSRPATTSAGRALRALGPRPACPRSTPGRSPTSSRPSRT
jgi:hypothetical protein